MLTQGNKNGVLETVKPCFPNRVCWSPCTSRRTMTDADIASTSVTTPVSRQRVPWSFPQWIAHRGAGKLAPENTLAAFRVGAGHGMRAFECDVRLSADGVVFLLHDDELQRTTGVKGMACEQTWSDLSRLDAGGWHGDAYAGEPIASLESIARYVLRNRFALNIEIKPAPGQEFEVGREISRQVVGLWAPDPLAHRPLLSSFAPDALAGARQGAGELPRALLIDTLRQGWLDEVQALDCVAVVAAYPLLEAGIIERLRAAGVRAAAYTVNDSAEAHRLVALGVDSLITDEVAAFSPASSGVRVGRTAESNAPRS